MSISVFCYYTYLLEIKVKLCKLDPAFLIYLKVFGTKFFSVLPFLTRNKDIYPKSFLHDKSLNRTWHELSQFKIYSTAYIYLE